MDTFAKEGDFVLNSLLLFYKIESSQYVSKNDLRKNRKRKEGMKYERSCNS